MKQTLTAMPAVFGVLIAGCVGGAQIDNLR